MCLSIVVSSKENIKNEKREKKEKRTTQKMAKKKGKTERMRE